MGERVGRGGMGRRCREEGVNGNVEGVNESVGGAPDFSKIISQQLQILLPAMLALVGNQGNFRNQNGNVVNENVGNVLVNGNRVGCSYKEFLASLKAEMAEINNNLMRVLQPPLAILKTYMLQEPIKGGDLPVLDLRTMEELCQLTLNGRGGPIVPIVIQATNFGLKNDMIQQVQNSCPFREPGDDANKHLDKYLHVTQSMKVNGVSDDALRLYLFPYSMQHRAAKWFDRLPRNSITTFDQMEKIFLGKYFPPYMGTKLRNDIMNFHHEPDESLFEAWERYKISIDRCPNHNMLPVTQIDTFYNRLTLRHHDTINAAAGEIAVLKLEMAEINKNFMKMLQTNQQVNSATQSYKTCGGPHSYINCPTTVGQTQNVYAAGAYNQGGVDILIMIVQPPLAKLRTYVLREPIIKVLATQGEQLKSMSTQLTPLDVSPVDINPIDSSADEEGGTPVVRCENDASIQKSNGLATSEKEMETRVSNTRPKTGIGYSKNL
uniref:Retrotransposon gag domain-containing protein n=1 Tax=Tanacetum cinerariifolium TaxID=118510 RepID=A0A6L2LN68_TANCI|nr:hypothetical protein [Tanacetum cinerariifolium]